jgi:hypothetical protein
MPKLGLVNEGTLADGTAVEIVCEDYKPPLTVWAEPAGGDTVTVTYKSGRTATAQAWPNGTAGAVTAYAEDVLLGPVYSVLFQRTAGSGTTSKFGVKF